jgi:hypothetical protein
MIPNNDPLYQTKNSKIQRFAPFMDNIKKEKEDLEKVKRQNRDDEVSGTSTPHSGQDEMHWNTVTNKMDKNLSKSQIEDRIKALEDGEETKSKDHKYKIVDEKKVIRTFENFVMDKGGKEVCDSCGCEDCECVSPQDTGMMDQDEVNFESDVDETSYMFFGNLETIHRMCTEMCEMDQSKVNDMLNDGHNWAEDHISVAKENISHVFNFLSNKEVTENMDMPEMGHSENHNYMFFGNIESICRMVEKILEFNQLEVDSTLGEGHDWAEDHISAAKENVQQVHDWLENELH